MTYELNDTDDASAPSSRSRQFIMHYLRQADRPVPISRLAEKLAAWEAERTGEGASEYERQEIYTWLITEQIPRLDEHDLIEYDERTRTVTPL